MYSVINHSLLALLTAFAIAAVLGLMTIPLLQKLTQGQTASSEGPKPHTGKKGTSTIGGIIMMSAIILSTLFWARGSYTFVLTALLMSMLFGLVGFVDDFIKVNRNQSKGLNAWQKIVIHSILALGFAFWFYRMEDVGPFVWNGSLNIGGLYIPFAVLVIVATVNSVNLTDGIDGLAGSVTSVYTLFMGLLLCITVVAAPATADPQELLDRSALGAFSMAVSGACIGFLLFNMHPSRVSMGDTGSHIIGGAIAAIALMSGTALLLPLMCVCFAASSVSVILQIATNHLRNGKRLFRMAPIYHHFQMKGVPEAKIISIYSIITLVSSAAALLIYWVLQ